MIPCLCAVHAVEAVARGSDSAAKVAVAVPPQIDVTAQNSIASRCRRMPTVVTFTTDMCVSSLQGCHQHLHRTQRIMLTISVITFIIIYTIIIVRIIIIPTCVISVMTIIYTNIAMHQCTARKLL
ncbi:hypothetical protein ElyMa_001925900 [Elysia marginata]|uniref:Uncharacterized protein n=1 Tax=Elysia marginata TaxID=1093978 RepID=A0AAV4EU78_9GAST|nr:hypothetical protein ElyMa_001925900 [Elysia marginata]